MKTGVKKPLIDSLEYVFTFGKHKGVTAEDVMNDEPNYFLWLEENEVAEIDESIIDAALKKLLPDVEDDWFLKMLGDDD